jgi:CRP/FNR family transcriptional regulator, cyclic AMP receptor protein
MARMPATRGRDVVHRAPSGFADTAPSSTLSMDALDDDAVRAPVMARWSERRSSIRARAAAAAPACDRLAALWSADRHMSRLPAADLVRLAAAFEMVEVERDQALIEQDEEGDYLLVVLDGVVVVERVAPGGERLRLAEARAGDLLGEMSLLDAGARFSTCTTATVCTVAVIQASRLAALLADEPRLGVALLASLARRLSLRLRHQSARLSALLNPS